MVPLTCDLVERLMTIPDHRRQCRNLRHRLVDILVLGFCGTLAGCDDFVEITDLPQLLELLDLRHKIVTADAMGCQKEIAQVIRDQKGDYILAAKANQPTLHAEMQAAFAQAARQPSSGQHVYTTEDNDHGR